MGGGTNGLVFDELIIDKPDANTEYMEIIGNGGNGKAETPQKESTEVKDYLLLDDAACPYTGVPRIVIETEKHRAIKDRETEIPAKLQIWDEKKPNSDIMELTIRGRGNSSWTVMP